MICSSSSEDDLAIAMGTMKDSASSKSQMLDLIKNEHFFDKDEDLEDEQKEFVRETLKRYEGKHLSDREFRILQGVLTADFGKLEHIHKQEKIKIKSIKKLKGGLKKQDTLTLRREKKNRPQIK